MNRNNSDILPTVIIGPAVLSADNTPTAIDLIDASSNELHVFVGIGGITFTGTNRIDVKVTHSDDDVTYAVVGESDVVINGDTDNAMPDVATGNVLSLTSAHAAADVTRVAYVGGKRYIKVLVDFGGTHGSGTPITVALVQSRLRLAGAA